MTDDHVQVSVCVGLRRLITRKTVCSRSRLGPCLHNVSSENALVLHFRFKNALSLHINALKLTSENNGVSIPGHELDPLVVVSNLLT